LSDQQLRTMAGFVAKGGQVIADVPPGVFDIHGRRRITPHAPVAIVAPDDLAKVLTLAPAFQVSAPDNDVETYVYRSLGQRLLALQRRKAGLAPESVTVNLNGWQARGYGRQQRLTLTLGPVTPSILELTR
jgi:hypothetical protein